MKRKFDFKKLLACIKDFIINNKVFLIYVLFSVLIGLLLRFKTIEKPLYFKAFVSDLIVVLFLGSFSYLMKNKNRFKYFFVIILFFSLLSIGNTIYYDFYKSYISISLIGTTSMVGQVNDALWAKIHLHQFIYLIFPVSFLLLKKLKIKDVYDDGKKIFKKVLLVNLVIFLCVCLTVTRSDTSRFFKLWNREYIVKKYGLYIYTFNDLLQSLQPKISEVFGYDDAAYNFRNFYACKFKEKKTSNEYTDLFKGKNVIFIHAESIQNFLINLKINDEYVTPNFNKLSSSGIYFSKFYPQISVGTSSDTEFTLSTGLMPSSSGTVFVNYFDRKYYSIQNYFNNMGYYTFSAHANNREYWNRSLMHNNLGYKDFFAKDNFIIPSEDDSEYVGLGLGDKSFFKQLIPILKDINNNKSPYMGTVITLSNHSPFNDIEKYGEFDVTMKYSYTDEFGNKVSGVAPYLDGTTMGNYLKSAHYADEALGEFINELKSEGLLKDTVIIIYGDHEARIDKKDFNLLYNYDPVSDEILSSEDENYVNMDNYAYDLLKNTPLIIYTEDETIKMQIDKVMGMYDVLPTVANLFGFKEKYSLGHDIFDNYEGRVVFPNGNVLTDSVYYSDLNDEYITFNNNPIDSDYINNLKEYANKALDVSNGIIVHDLIRKEENKIGECIHE